MNTLEMNKMAVIEDGKPKCMSCERAIVIGAIMGSWFGPEGTAAAVTSVAFGENCLNAFHQNNCE